MKIIVDPSAAERLFTDVFLQSHKRPPKRIVLDLDATDDPIHTHPSALCSLAPLIP